ncbi:MAG TPA: tRNA pseudouridine(38-40) synthase TruA [Syntrophorhabdaceae bacterium]|jgi:tRNA pseudouridine38-40 synthase
MRNIRLLVSYDGTAYHGWQVQPNAISVQEILQKAIDKVVNEPAKIYGGARTDAGVHALGQVVNFSSESGIDLVALPRAINSLIPRDIRVTDAQEVPPEFHSRYSAKTKVYIYTILNRRIDSPFYGRYSWHLPSLLRTDLMADTIRIVEGSHDFSSFKKKDESYRSTVREVVRAAVRKRGDCIHISLEGTGFLRYMVRNIVGTLVLVGSGKLSRPDFQEILDARDRERAGPTAPAKGLLLKKIKY